MQAACRLPAGCETFGLFQKRLMLVVLLQPTPLQVRSTILYLTNAASSKPRRSENVDYPKCHDFVFLFISLL
jgi:hypothetical protein